MDRATLQVAARSSPDEGLILSVGGYLDEIGALSLAHETRSAPVDGPRHVRIDLGKVCLFNCSADRFCRVCKNKFCTKRFYQPLSFF